MHHRGTESKHYLPFLYYKQLYGLLRLIYLSALFVSFYTVNVRRGK